MRLNSLKLFLVGAFALTTSLTFAQVIEPTDSIDVEPMDSITMPIQDEKVSLGETLVVGKGLIDIAEDRKTPIAASTIKKEEIQDKTSGNVDFPEIFATTPSVYISDQSAGFGDSKMYVRGFDSQNTAYLLNGQPVNDMENGKVYWSNWSAMKDVANVVQIQRGLGSSKLAISSVGGTINLVTKTTDKKEGGYVSFNTANDSYIGTTVSYNTGMKGKWAASFLFNTWQAHRAFAQGTNGQGQTYFVSVGYKPNKSHQFNFLIFGAPQTHGLNYTNKSESQWANGSMYGKKYNTTYGFHNGRGENLRINYYHKPVANLNWDWTINNKASLSTVLYASVASGGGTSGVGTANKTTRDGLVDFDAIENNNINTVSGIGNSRSNGAVRTSVNKHVWYGAISNFNYDTKTGWNFNAGTDIRFYHGDHYQQMNNLYGLNGWSELNRSNNQNVVVTKTYSTNPWAALFSTASVDQRTNRDNSSNINYQGLFGQAEYTNDLFSIFVQGAVSNQFYQTFDRWNYGGVKTASEKVNKTGWNLKGGAALNLNKENSVYANVGRYSRQPFLNNVFEYNSVSLRNPATGNEEITGFEAGYKYHTKTLQFSFNAYHTTWGHRFLGVNGQLLTDPINNPSASRPIYTSYSNISEVHKGLEFDFNAKVSNVLGVYGFMSIGDWKYDGETPYQSQYTDDNVIFEQSTINLKGTNVGGASQFTFGLGTKVNFTKNLHWDVDFMYNGRTYGEVNPTEVVKSATIGEVYQAREIPAFAKVNSGLSYKFFIGKQSIKFRGNVRNLFNEQYMISADRYGYGYMIGRTWSLAATYSF